MYVPDDVKFIGCWIYPVFLMLTYCCVIFGEYPYANQVVPLYKDVDVLPSVEQPNVDNCLDVKAL